MMLLLEVGIPGYLVTFSGQEGYSHYSSYPSLLHRLDSEEGLALYRKLEIEHGMAYPPIQLAAISVLLKLCFPT